MSKVNGVENLRQTSFVCPSGNRTSLCFFRKNLSWVVLGAPSVGSNKALLHCLNPAVVSLSAVGHGRGGRVPDVEELAAEEPEEHELRQSRLPEDHRGGPQHWHHQTRSQRGPHLPCCEWLKWSRLNLWWPRCHLISAAFMISPHRLNRLAWEHTAATWWTNNQIKERTSAASAVAGKKKRTFPLCCAKVLGRPLYLLVSFIHTVLFRTNNCFKSIFIS